MAFISTNMLFIPSFFFYCTDAYYIALSDKEANENVLFGLYVFLIIIIVKLFEYITVIIIYIYKIIT